MFAAPNRVKPFLYFGLLRDTCGQILAEIEVPRSYLSVYYVREWQATSIPADSLLGMEFQAFFGCI